MTNYSPAATANATRNNAFRLVLLLASWRQRPQLPSVWHVQRDEALYRRLIGRCEGKKLDCLRYLSLQTSADFGAILQHKCDPMRSEATYCWCHNRLVSHSCMSSCCIVCVHQWQANMDEESK